MQPWRELARKPQPAENGLLLDYVSPNLMTVFTKSLSRRHWPVSAAVLGSFLLTALIVVSTGLFSLQTLSMPQSLPFSMNEQFSFVNFNSAAVDDVAAAFYAGVSFEGLDYPPGTNSGFAVEMFNSSQTILAESYSLTADAKTFTADLVCEPATLFGGIRTTCPPWSGCTSVSATLAVQNTKCLIPLLPDDGTPFYVEGNGYGGWYGDVFPGSCEENDGDSDQERLVVFCMNMAPGQGTINGTYLFTNNTALICKPSYTIQHSTVTIDSSGSLKKIENNTQLQTPSTLTSTDISKAVRNTINQLGYGSIGPRLVDNSSNIDNDFGQAFGTFFRLILSSQGFTDIADVLNSQSLAEGAQHVFQGVAAQIGRRYLLTANSTSPSLDFRGMAEYEQQRLVVRPLSLRLMESMLCILGLLSLYLVFKASRGITPQDPAPIARLASLISLSRDFTGILSLTGSWPAWNLKQLLRGNYIARFASAADPHHPVSRYFVIEHYGEVVQQSVDIKEEYWKPLATSWFARVTLLILPLCITIALESTLQKSQHSGGILNVNLDRETQLGSSFVPALIMVLTNLMFSAFDFNLRVLNPYVQLRNGFAKADRSLLDKSIYTWKTHAFWDSFVKRQAAVGASTLAVLFASFLTIAASGLYTVEEVASQITVSLGRSDTFFNPVQIYNNSYGAPLNTPVNYKSALAARLVANERMSSPLWTSGPYVIPHLYSLPNVSHSLENASAVSSQIPVQQGVLTCTLVPSDQVTVNHTYWGNFSNDSGNVEWSFPNAVNCTNLVRNSQAGAILFGMNDGLFAQWNSFQFMDNGTNCPASWAVYGVWQGGQTTEVNVVTCQSSIQEKQASVHFSLPDWKVSSLTINEATTKNISTTQDTLLNLDEWVFSDVTSAGSIDNVFEAFLRDKTTDTLDTNLLEARNFDKLYARILEVYGLAYAQVLNGQGRRNSSTTEDTTNTSGTATIASSYRLKQSSISTRILQSLLIAMFLCSLLFTFPLRPVRVVPKNPCSIVAQASLVAGSQMMAKLPADSQWMSDKEFEALFAGSRYSMGWGGTSDGEERFGIDLADAVRLEPQEYKSRVFRLWGRRRNKRLT